VRGLRIEIALLLAVSVGYSAASSTVSFIQTQVRYGSFRHTTAALNISAAPDRHWFDLAYQLLGYARGLGFAGLALYLLARTPPGAAAIAAAGARRGFGIGADFTRMRRDCQDAAAMAAIVGLPGLGLYFAARGLGMNATIATSGLPDVWWRYPALVISAFENGALEEIIWIGFLLPRFRQIGWSMPRAILVSAAIRGMYHAYQGYGGLVGNMAMGVIYSLYYLRRRRVMPLVIAHGIQDTVVFIGYAALSPHWAFIR
jgi:membrane protease YdiL (CAAX protease family)